jgi:hypothetical protein
MVEAEVLVLTDMSSAAEEDEDILDFSFGIRSLEDSSRYLRTTLEVNEQKSRSLW